MRLRLCPRRAGSLVEVLLVCALLVGLAVWLAPKYLGRPQHEQQGALTDPACAADGRRFVRRSDPASHPDVSYGS